MKILQEPFYLPSNSGKRFCIWRAPSATEPMRGIVLHVPAFAEEMNKSRRMTAWAAREFALRGFGVLQIDLLGCGDSEGDFGDATWDVWIDDVVAASSWMRARCGGPFWLWGLRAGALLASAALPFIASWRTSLLLWQPVLSGRQSLTQFLRLRLAADLLAEAPESGGTKLLRDELRRGHALEVAGYRLSPALATGLEAAEFSLPEANVGRVAWLELSTSDPAQLSPVARSRVAALQSHGVEVSAAAMRGPGFWQTSEIEDCPELIEVSVKALQSENERELSRNPALL